MRVNGVELSINDIGVYIYPEYRELFEAASFESFDELSSAVMNQSTRFSGLFDCPADKTNFIEYLRNKGKQYA